jgi:hypothetical protein
VVYRAFLSTVWRELVFNATFPAKGQIFIEIGILLCERLITNSALPDSGG